MSPKKTKKNVKEMKWYKEIKIPHLRYTVYVNDLSKLKIVGKDIGGSAFATRLDDYSTAIFIKDIEKTLAVKENMALVAHEVMHLIQILCNEFNMNIEQEQEHTAYIMTYLLEQIFDLTLSPKE